ncbi:MAG: MBL fold metallo-hydrolase [Candidatus Bathyarchaeia archaeon]
MRGLKLTDRIYLIGGGAYGYSAPGDCNIYLVDCGGKLAMIDTGGGAGIPKVLENIETMGFDPEALEVALITHCHYDHIGGNRDLKEATGCRIAAHEAEVEEIEVLGTLSLYDMAREQGLEFEPAKVDIALKDGQHLRIGEVDFEIVHTPGHTPGGVCFLMGEGDGVSLFTGDTASAQGRLGWVNGPGCDLSEWKRSIGRLLDLGPDRMFPGHGVFVLSGAVEHLRLLDDRMNAPWVNIVTAIG